MLLLLLQRVSLQVSKTASHNFDNKPILLDLAFKDRLSLSEELCLKNAPDLHALKTFSLKGSYSTPNASLEPHSY